MLVGNIYNLLLDSRGRRKDLGHTKQVKMEGRMREKAQCSWPQRVLQKTFLVKSGFDSRSFSSVGRHADYYITKVSR